ncbi:MAG: gephyrin-like molybdotransferase Glp [Bauldia sp.]
MSLLPVSEAIGRIVGGIARKDAETVSLAAAHGRVLAEPLVARRTQPPFDASAMDGYAVRAGDATSGKRLRVIGQSVAGQAFRGTVGAGEAVRILTGAPVPAGADAILLQEDAEKVGDETIAVKEDARTGQFIRRRGLDFAEGATVLPAGRRLMAADLSVAAAMDHASLSVVRRPRVAILATGDELVPPGTPRSADQIVSSSTYGIAAIAADAGGAVSDLGIARDDLGALGDAVDRALAGGADILVTLGGASSGDRDLIKPALAARGLDLDFWKIALRPGKPLLFGRLGSMAVLGLPGNPVSSLVCGILFLVPLISAFLGKPAEDPSEPAVLGVDVRANDGRLDYQRARLEVREGDLPVATPFPVQDSSMLSVLAAADCLLIRAPRAPAAAAGTACRVVRLRRPVAIG